MIRIYDMATGALLDSSQASTHSEEARSEGLSYQPQPALQLQEIPLKSEKASPGLPCDLATKSIDNFISKQ